ncbi:hypothetical protein Nepgr_029393 [Nepenthes gracilis]|uniref:Proteasome assembly chaperone 1 n=1 Tax=Nepenthes gracilis TaxID=150966 RepID=A0AAD3TDH6_NEPGR|nr:hypothetical protein Nepgr_029393 [Nepenthes gracilis]
MEDVLTEIPPPSRFFQEDLNNFIPPPPSLPTPFLLFSDPYATKILHPSILIIAISPSSLQIFHRVSAKTLIGTLVLPEIPFSGNSIKASLKDKSCNIYSLNDSEKLVCIISVQCSVPAERSHVVSKLLLGGQIFPERVLILDSIQSQNFRSKLSWDETLAYKLETSSERKEFNSGHGGSSLLKDVDYFPSGSVVDGLAAALLARCQILNIKGTLHLSWPKFGTSVILLLRSLLLNDVLAGLEFGSNGDYEDQHFNSGWKDPLVDAELYT